MYNFQKIIVLTVSLLLSAVPVGATPDTAEGQKLYAQGKLAESAACLNSVVARAPHDASAHYLLGNIHATQGDLEQAEIEYLKAINLDPSGTAGVYSRRALEGLEQSRKRAPAAISGNSHAGETKNNAPEQDATSDALMTRKSASDISGETNRRESALLSERDSKIKTITKEGDERVKKLEDERQERITANGSLTYQRNRYGGTVVVFDPAQANEAVRQEYIPKIEEVKEQTVKRIDEVMNAYREKAGAIEDSAISLHKEYLQSGRSAKLSPARTNMYTRNYETADEASGSPVPVQAAPARALAAPQTNNLIHTKK